MTTRPAPDRPDTIHLADGWAIRPNYQDWSSKRQGKVVRWKITLHGEVKPFMRRGPRGGIVKTYNIADPLEALLAAGVTMRIYSENKQKDPPHD